MSFEQRLEKLNEKMRKWSDDFDRKVESFERHIDEIIMGHGFGGAQVIVDDYVVTMNKK
jgi:hypothetical protein